MDTVTLSLEKYESLVNKIKELEKEVEQKTIIKEVKPEWWRITLVAVVIVAWTICLALAFSIPQ